MSRNGHRVVMESVMSDSERLCLFFNGVEPLGS